jgi:hypothetical protein
MTLTADLVSERFLPLFDPAETAPPAGATEIYFETPVTLGLLHTFSQRYADQPELAAAARAAHAAGTRAALQAIARDVMLKVGEHTEIPGRPSMGRYLPGRVPLTVVSHSHVGDPGDIARFHDHVFIGRRGIADVDGQWWPVDLDGLFRGLRSFATHHTHQIQLHLQDELGARWSGPEDRTWMGFQELVQPNLAQYVGDFPRLLCDYGNGSLSADRWNAVNILERL